MLPQQTNEFRHSEVSRLHHEVAFNSLIVLRHKRGRFRRPHPVSHGRELQSVACP